MVEQKDLCEGLGGLPVVRQGASDQLMRRLPGEVLALPDKDALKGEYLPDAGSKPIPFGAKSFMNAYMTN
jgi:hypothetical protein